MTRWIVLTMMLALAPPSWAGKSEQRAEVNRLLEEIERLAEKNAWAGVERAYLKLVSLDRRGERLDHDVHLLGATAAQARGDTFAVYQRLRRAQQTESRESTMSWLATLVATNTKVSLEISPLVAGVVPLESIDPITDPAQLKVLQAARETLTERRYFEGLLPMGRYRFGDKRFDLYGQEDLEVAVWPGENQLGPSSSNATVAAAAPKDTLVLASTRPLEGGAYQSAADGVRFALVGVQGIQEVEVRPLPPLRLYADFDEGTLTLLQLDTRSVADAVAKQLEIPLGQIAVRPTSVAVPSDGRSADQLGRVKLAISDGEVDLDAIGAVREAPDRTAPTPGLDVKLAEGADVEAVRQAVASALESSAPARALGLTLQ